MNNEEMKQPKSELPAKINALRKCVERCSCIRLRTPKDYDDLATHIFQTTHANVSVSTLKRLMGYLPGNKTMPRTSTLDILSRYVGYVDFDTFSESFDKHGNNIAKAENVELKRMIHSVKLQLENLEEQLLKIEETL